MKRFLLIVSLLVASVSASAMGFRSLDLKANLRSDFGLGVGMSFNLPANFEFAPSFNYYFDSGNAFTIDADFRYRFDLPKSFSPGGIFRIYIICDKYEQNSTYFHKNGG